MKGPEAIIKDEIRAWLRAQGAYVFSPVQQGYGMQTLDLLVCWGGKFVAIEVKAPGKKPTPRQVNIMVEIENTKGLAFWVESLSDVKEVLLD